MSLSNVTDSDTQTDAAAMLEGFREVADRPGGRFDIACSEALFGWREISPWLQAGMSCLEIGAGSGLLAALVARHVTRVEAVEPAADGFSENGEILTRVCSASPERLVITREAFENITDDQAYDLIWSVNVFEHLDDWRVALEKAYSLLKPGGRCIILCPNYTIPYEPHFGLPIIAGPQLTYRLFEKQILSHEQDRNAEGLWETVNFIKAGAVLNHCKHNAMPVQLDKGLLRRMFDRMLTETNIGERHGVMRRIVAVAHRIRLTELVCSLPPTLHPYSGFHLEKPAD